MHVVFIVTPNCCWGGKKCIIIDYTQFLKCEVGNKGKSCWRGKKGRNRNERVELDAWTVGSCGFISDVLKNLLLGSMSSSIILLGGEKMLFTTFFVLLFSLSLQNAEWWRDPKLSEVQPRVLVQSSAASLLLNRVSPIHLTYTLALPFFKSSRPHLRNQSWCKIKNKVFSV